MDDELSKRKAWVGRVKFDLRVAGKGIRFYTTNKAPACQQYAICITKSPRKRKCKPEVSCFFTGMFLCPFHPGQAERLHSVSRSEAYCAMALCFPKTASAPSTIQNHEATDVLFALQLRRTHTVSAKLVSAPFTNVRDSSAVFMLRFSAALFSTTGD